jgi:hypothetical protein
MEISGKLFWTRQRTWDATTKPLSLSEHQPPSDFWGFHRVVIEYSSHLKYDVALGKVEGTTQHRTPPTLKSSVSSRIPTPSEYGVVEFLRRPCPVQRRKVFCISSGFHMKSSDFEFGDSYSRSRILLNINCTGWFYCTSIAFCFIRYRDNAFVKQQFWDLYSSVKLPASLTCQIL